LRLFLEEEIHRNDRYSAYVSNLKLAPAEVWRIYRGRGDAENRIKELKYDFGFDSFNLKAFYATEAALTFAMIGYKLIGRGQAHFSFQEQRFVSSKIVL